VKIFFSSKKKQFLTTSSYLRGHFFVGLLIYNRYTSLKPTMLFVFDHEFVSSRSFYKFIFSFFFKEDDNFSLIFFIPYVVVKTQKKAFVEFSD